MALNQGNAYACRNDPSKPIVPGGGSQLTCGRSSNSRAPQSGVRQMRISCKVIVGLHVERFLQLSEQVEHLGRDWLVQPRGKHRAEPRFSGACLRVTRPILTHAYEKTRKLIRG